MKLNKPKNITFIIAVILALLAIISKFMGIPFITDNNFLVLAIGFILLALGNLVKGL
jgi:hypothetical protein